MKNLEKVLLVIVTILIIALIAMTVAFFNMRKNAEDNLQELLNSKKKMTVLKEKLNAQFIYID